MKNLTKEEIIQEIKDIAESQNYKWINDYKTAKEYLLFKDKNSGVITKTTWSTLKNSGKGKIPIKNTNLYHEFRLDKIMEEFNFTKLSNYKSYKDKIKYKCNTCEKVYNRCLHKIYKCSICNNFYEKNKGINKTNVLRDPYIKYNLYFVYLEKYGCFKIGLYKKEDIKKRFAGTEYGNVKIIFTKTDYLYNCYYIEQFIIKSYKKWKYKGAKFGGYTEAFNTNINVEEIIKIMAASIKDVEPCELLENLEADNQQPSFIEI